MSFLTRLAQQQRASAITLHNLFGGMFSDTGETAAGKNVTPNSALGLTAVFSAIWVISEGFAQMPTMVYQRKKGGGRAKAWFDPTYRLLHDRPNPEMTPMRFKSTVQAWVEGWGNAFVGKQFSPSGKIIEALWPIHPERVLVQRINGVKQYLVVSDTKTTTYTDRDIIHFMGPSTDGFVGLSPLQVARQAIGLGLGLEEYAGKLMGERAVPAGLLTTDQPLNDDAAIKRARAQWNSLYKGSGNAQKVAVMPNGLKFQAISVPLADAQFVEQQKFNVQQVARIFRIAPSRIGGDRGASLQYSTIEGDALDYLTYTIQPRQVNFEQTLQADPDLFPDGSMYPETQTDSVLKADSLTRAKVYTIATGGAPYMKGSEVRDRENLEYDPAFDVVPAPDLAAAKAAAQEDLTQSGNPGAPPKPAGATPNA